MSNKTKESHRDYETERKQLLNTISKHIPIDIQKKIDAAVKVAPSNEEPIVTVSHEGTIHADNK